MVHIERTPLSSIRRAAVYVNSEKKPLREIVEEQRPDIALAAAFYSPAKWAPVCPVKADGDVLWSSPTDHYWALAWDTGPDVSEALVPPGGSCGRANYVANCLLIREGRPQPELYYNADVGGRRGRVAVGLTDTEWITYGAADGSGGACTPEQLRDCMAGLGCRFAVMMDGGGKVNVYVAAAGVLMEGRDPSQTLILLWLNTDEEDHAMGVKTYSVKSDGSKYLSANFKVSEFKCNDGSDMVLISDELVDLLQKIRDHFGKPVVINSGYRTSSYNAKVGGASRSQHLLGTAADITVSGAAPLEIARYAEFLMPDRGGIGVYQTFCHVDVRSARSRWDSRSGKEVVVSGWPGYSEETELDKAVAWITGAGIMQGNADGDLMLDQPLTRKQYALMEYRKHLADQK